MNSKVLSIYLSILNNQSNISDESSNPENRNIWAFTTEKISLKQRLQLRLGWKLVLGWLCLTCIFGISASNLWRIGRDILTFCILASLAIIIAVFSCLFSFKIKKKFYYWRSKQIPETWSYYNLDTILIFLQPKFVFAIKRDYYFCLVS